MKRPYKILVIDDEQGICEKIQTFFTKRGLIVETAFDGEEGLNKLRTNEFDIAIVDIKMPKMNGIEVAQYAYQEGIDTEIIMLTAHGDRNDAVAALKVHVQDWIDKDQVTMPLLFETVQKIIDFPSSEEIARLFGRTP